MGIQTKIVMAPLIVINAQIGMKSKLENRD